MQNILKKYNRQNLQLNSSIRNMNFGDDIYSPNSLPSNTNTEEEIVIDRKERDLFVGNFNNIIYM